MLNNLQSMIFSAGKAVTPNVLSLDIIQNVNRIPYAQVVIGEGTDQKLSPIELSDATCFQPGQPVEIVLSHADQKTTFNGIVLKQNLKKTGDNTFLTIDIKDKAHKLSLIRDNAVFNSKDDKTIIRDIAKKAGITVECDSVTLSHKQMVQYYCTSWDFIISRAEANGLLVCVDNGKLLLKKPVLSNTSTRLSEIREFEVEADLSGQYDEITGVGWDIKEAKPVTVTNNNSSITLNGKHKFSNLAQTMGTDKCRLVSGIYSDKAEMEAWANAGLIKNRYSMIRGRISIEGNPQIKLGDMITIDGAGEIFGATAIVSGVRHRINADGWTTDIQCGLSSKWFYKSDDIIEKPAAGLLPGINGLQIGIVEAYPKNGDPDKIYRIKVRIPAIDEKESVIWARLNLPYAGKNRGILWIPEEGDEVVVGFFNDDPRQAVVLGSLYNGQTKTPLQFTAKNNEKGIITRNNIKMVFTDEKDKEKLEITTPAGNKILLVDEKGITVEDKNRNKVIFHDKGVSFEDKNKNTITTNDKGTIVEDSNKNGLTLNNQGMEMKDFNGNTISLSSAGIQIKDTSGNKVALEASGITIQSSANVTVKGAIINLN
jgi:Rhs element Vgr protein